MSQAQELAERALALVRIPSPTGRERALADFLEQWARSLYPPEQVYRHSCSLLLGDLADPRPAVALLGHLDTVPPHPRAGSPRLEGGRLFGRGSSDMKGGLAVMMALAESLRDRALPHNLWLVFYEREEGPYLENGLGPLFAQEPRLGQARFGICLEPTDNRVQVGCAGSLHATLRFSGKSAHSARPWQGENAIHRAGPLLAELLHRPPLAVEVGGFRFQEVWSATQALGGSARNVVPDAFELNLNYRFAPGKSVEQAEQELVALVAGRAQVEVTDRAPAGRVCADNPLFHRLLAIGGLAAEAKQGWTDVGRLTELGVDAVSYGPGETAQAHREEESAPVDALFLAYQNLERFLSEG